jgi:nucleoside-diphosphate-sugar epimerase
VSSGGVTSERIRQLPREDLEHIVERASDVWDSLDGAKLFVTGGTGFFGRWLLESLLFAADRRRLTVTAVVLTRSVERFRRSSAAADDPRLRVLEGDVRSFDVPNEAFTHVIHAATDASARLNEQNPLLMLDTIIDGTRRVLEVARRSEARAVLFTSSGAVYGRQPPDLSHIPEEFPGGPDPVEARSAYAEGKRAAEQLCAAYGHDHGLAIKIARCFAFVGPHLPLDAHFAIGNFIRDALRGGPVEVRGDGTPYRSYLYAADLMVWLLTILVRARPMRPYNVGSDDARTVAEIARLVARIAGAETRVAGSPAPGVAAERYVPSTRRARDELGLSAAIPLDEAITRTLRWYDPTTGSRGPS